MTNQSNIERVVMRRVRTIRFLRLVVSTEFLSILLVIAALWGVGREVWVAKVFANGPQDAFGHALYLGYAFEHTRLAVQMLVVVGGLSLVTLAQRFATLVSRVTVAALA